MTRCTKYNVGEIIPEWAMSDLESRGILVRVDAVPSTGKTITESHGEAINGEWVEVIDTEMTIAEAEALNEDVTILATSGSVTIDVSQYSKFILSPSASVSLSLSKFIENQEINLIVYNGGTNVSWSDLIKWDNTDSFVPPTLQLNGYDIICITRVDDGKYIGNHVGCYDTSVTTSYDNTGGMGDRLSVISLIDYSLIAGGDYWGHNIYDGDYANSASWNSGSGYFTFDFDTPKCIQEIRLLFLDVRDTANVEIQASNDNMIYETLGTEVITLSYTQLLTSLASNNNYYRYYRICQNAGSYNRLSEIEFKISE